MNVYLFYILLQISQLSVLEESWVSQANARQRRGRAGRVRSGVCFHLASSVTFDDLPAFTVPEMLRLSLEEIILQVWILIECVHVCIYGILQ